MDIFSLLSQYVSFYPSAALGGLVLAGFNLPVSEDLVIITGALLSQGTTGLLVPSLLAIYAGVITSDFVSYGIGALVRKGTLRIPSAAAVLSPKNRERFHRHLDRHGFLTFIVCRFIPFGARNALFMSSGFLGLPIRRFALYDITAALISSSTLFFLAYHFGDEVRNPVRVAGIVLFVLVALTVLSVLVGLFLKLFPITPWGLPQAALFPALAGGLMAALFAAFRPALWLIPLEAALFLVLAWMVSFFRNPRRNIPLDESVLLSPADGTITEISETEHEELGRALRIGIFLSIFNVHLNRVPCSVEVERVVYKKGKFKDARSPDSGRVNESNDLFMTRLAEPRSRLLVRQVSGAIARRIVCKAKQNDQLKQGELFGMIKFGSRTELYVPLPKGGEKIEAAVNIGDAVRAGLSPLVKYV